MKPPTIEEVAAYVLEKGYTFDPELFVAKNEAKGWCYGKTPIKSWKAACRVWQTYEQKPDSYPSVDEIAHFNRMLTGASMEHYRVAFKNRFGVPLKEEPL